MALHVFMRISREDRQNRVFSCLKSCECLAQSLFFWVLAPAKKAVRMHMLRLSGNFSGPNRVKHLVFEWGLMLQNAVNSANKYTFCLF